MSSGTLSAILLIGLCGLVAACSAPGRNYTGSSMDETLEIEILPNTSKMFIYRLRAPGDREVGAVHIERGGNSHPEGNGGGIAVGRNTQERLHENAAYVVEHMGYCREGFLEIDSSASRFNLWLKGECKDGATDDDRKKFGEKKTLPVKFDR